MKFLRNIEKMFETYIEGYFNKKFTGKLQPVEFAKQLIKEMEENRSIGIAKIYVPNAYTIQVSPEEYKELAQYQQVLCRELATYLSQEISKKSYVALDVISVEIVASNKNDLRKFQIISKFTDSIPQEEPNKIIEEKADKVDSDTKVFAKVNSPLQQLEVVPAASLTVTAGVDNGIKLEVGRNRINIGRRENNELPLSDMNTSRLHAYIVYEQGSHVVYDAKSLNGTYLNGNRTTRKILESGDVIKLGNTTIVYEVK